jgi:hypothetical protein
MHYLIIFNGADLLLPVPCDFMMALFTWMRKDLKCSNGTRIEPGWPGIRNVYKAQRNIKEVQTTEVSRERSRICGH